MPYCLTALMVVLLPVLPAELVPQNDQPFGSVFHPVDSGPSDTNKVVVEVSGFSAAALEQLKRPNGEPAEWQRLLSAYVEQDELVTGSSVPPMLGVYSFEENVLRFTPQFPLTPGLKYRAVFRPGQLPGERSSDDAALTATFQMPRRESNPTLVTRFIRAPRPFRRTCSNSTFISRPP